MSGINLLKELLYESGFAVQQKATLLDNTEHEFDLDIGITTAPLFDPKNAQAFRDGFGLAFVDGRITYFQSFYVDEEEAKLSYLNRYEPLV
jgi:hypothetical protein